MSNNDFTFTIDNELEIKDGFREIFMTDLGKKYLADYHDPELESEHEEMILRAAQAITGSQNITVNAMLRGLELLISAGEIRPRDPEEFEELVEPEPDTRPRTKEGKLMTDAQIRWSEYRQFAESHSSEECRKRAREDSGFRTFMSKSLQHEMGDGSGVDGAVVPIGEQNLLPRHDPDQSLKTFAQKYIKEPIANLRPKGGFVTLAGEQIPYQTFLALVGKATQARLI